MAESALVKKELDEMAVALGVSPDLAQMYQESAGMGSDNLGESLPMLKVHFAGRSKNVLFDGKKPTDGWFFHTKSQRQFEFVDCHILSVSRGFRSQKPKEYLKPGDKEEQYQQIIAGCLIEDGKLTDPFMMYIKGINLPHLWEFGKEAKKFTKARMPIPMFAMTVRLTAVEEKTQRGNDVWAINYEIVKDNGKLVLLTDPGEFQFLKDMIPGVEQTMESIVSRGVSEESIEEATVVADDQVGTVVEEMVEEINEPVVKKTQEEVDPSDIPF